MPTKRLKEMFHIKKASIAFCIASLLFTVSCGSRNNVPQKPSTDTIPAMVMQIKKQSRLYAAECKVRKIVTHDDKISVKGKLFSHDYDIGIPFSERKIAIPMDATVKAFIDFSNFSEANVKRHGNKIEIILPDPQLTVTSTRIDHAGIKRQVAFMRSDFSDAELSGYEKQGREAIIKNLPETRIIETARQSAAKIIVPMAEQMGFAEEDIKVTFRKDFNLSDIMTLINKNGVEDESYK